MFVVSFGARFSKGFLCFISYYKASVAVPLVTLLYYSNGVSDNMHTVYTQTHTYYCSNQRVPPQVTQRCSESHKAI